MIKKLAKTLTGAIAALTRCRAGEQERKSIAATCPLARSYTAAL